MLYHFRLVFSLPFRGIQIHDKICHGSVYLTLYLTLSTYMLACQFGYGIYGSKPTIYHYNYSMKHTLPYTSVSPVFLIFLQLSIALHILALTHSQQNTQEQYLLSFISSGPPIVTISSHNVSKHTDGNNNVSLTWTLSNGYSTDYYLISITTNAPWTPYLGFLNITTSSVRQQELTDFMVGYEYNITVRGVTANCGGLVGEESEPLKVTLQGMYTMSSHFPVAIMN